MVIVNEKEDGLSKFISGVYAWMFLGLLISGFVGYFTSVNEMMLNIVNRYFVIIVVLEIAIVIAFSALRNKVSSGIAKLLFILYSVFSGLTLSSIFVIYKLGSIFNIFLVSSLMFGLMAIYGYITKTDLTKLSRILIFGLLAVILISLINIFVGNQHLNIGLCTISVVLFLGLTAWDMQMLKNLYYEYSNDNQHLNKLSIYGALNLYLDFINIFLELLRLFGKAKD